MNFIARTFQLAARGEPYRILFPLGIMLGVLGAMLWPAFVYGWLPLYPGPAHSRIMVQGFIFSFMAGFLGSALPHMLELKGMSLAQTALIALMILAASFLHLFGYAPAGDAVFSAAIATLVILVLRRWPERRDLPPPGMVLAGMGLISGFIGSAMLAMHPTVILPGWLYILARALLNHGLVLFPVLGLGAYLLPRMAGLPNLHLIPKSPVPSPAWVRRAAFMFGCGLLLLISFVLEAAGLARVAFALRVVTASFCLLHEVPLFRARQLKGSIPWSLVIAAASILSGYLLLAIWPHRQTSMIHVVFISGFGLLILNIAARVVLGHSGNTSRIYTRIRPVNWIAGLAMLAMATRVSADLIPRMQLSHYAYAGITWAVISLIWLACFSPYLSGADGAE